ncbi:MAG: hypothetical protein OHK0045_06530 [Raineya sp.]
MKKIILILLVFSATQLSSFAQEKQKEKKKAKKESKAKNETAQDKILLRNLLKKGESYEQTMENESKIQIMGMEIQMTQVITAKNVVTDVDAAGNLTQESTIEKFYMKQSNPMIGELEYDSENTSKQSPELAAQVGQIKGKKSILKITPTGQILEAPKEMSSTVGSSGQFPQQAVGVGDTWEISSTTNNPMLNKEITSNNQYKLIERTAGKAIIEINGKMVAEGKEIGSFSGKMTIEEATGITLESDILQKLNMQMQGMESQVEGKIKIKGKKI